MEKIKENRSRLIPIVETISFVGRQNIPLRGHRDDGQLDVDNNSPINEGNFRALLKFRIQSGDIQLRNHLESSSVRSTYISKTTQNELIICCGQEILSAIISRIQKAVFYGIIFDETTDVSHKSQLSLVIRYIYDNTIREDFIQFIDLHDEIMKEDTINNEKLMEPKVTGSKLGKIVVKTLESLNLDLKNCIAITTDGCSMMVSETCGAVEEVLKVATNAVHCPCYNHYLNNSLSASSDVQIIRNSVGTMKETISFFNASAKRSNTLRKIMGGQLCGLCETRWIERHDGVLQFRVLLPKIIETLNHVSQWQDSKTSSKANALKIVLCESNFLVAVVCLSDVLNTTQSLSYFLQKKQIDLKSAQDMVQDTLKLLQRKRENCEEKFRSFFEEVKNIANDIGVEIKMPRVARIQRNRDNYPVNGPETYFRQAVYIPVLDNVMTDLKNRFSTEALDLYSFSVLFPDSVTSKDSTLSKEAVKKLCNRYSTFFKECPEVLEISLTTELEMWHMQCDRRNYDSSISAMRLFNCCDVEIYPLLHTLFKIFLTMPSSGASAERSFSTLKRLKTYLRSTTTEERLNGLALLHIHYDIEVNVDQIINRYAKTCKHRLNFML